MRRCLAFALAAVALTGCTLMAGADPSPTPPRPAPAGAAIDWATPSPTPVLTLPPGYSPPEAWLVVFRAMGHQRVSEAYVMKPTCGAGLCDAEVSVLSATGDRIDGGVFRVVDGTLRYEGEREELTSCAAPGKPVANGATASITTTLIITMHRPAGAAVTSIQLSGTRIVHSVPLTGSGCQEGTVTYSASGTATTLTAVTPQTPEPVVSPTPASGGITGDLVYLPKLSVSVWNATATYFAISGRNPNELIESAEKNLTRECPDAIACVEPDLDGIQPTYTIDPNTGTCTTWGLSGTAVYLVHMPRWTKPSPVPGALLDWWKQVLEHVRWHEEQHVRIFEKWIPTLASRLAGQPCSSSSSIAASWQGDVGSAQDTFDDKDATWTAPPYSGPWDW